MSEYKTIRVNGRTHVLKNVNRNDYVQRDGRPVKVDRANYMDTGMALCGILKYGQTLDEWIKERNK